MADNSISASYRAWLMFRSAVFWVWLIFTTLFFAIPALLGTLISFNVAYGVSSYWIKANMWGLRILCGVKWEVRGQEHIPADPCLVVSKHQSTWETFFLAYHLKHVLFVAKRSLALIPIFGWMLYLLGFVLIDRKSGRSAINQMIEQASDRISKRRWVVVFPEGTRMPVGAEPNYRIGAMKVSSETDIPMLPVAVNSGEFWPRMGFIKWPGTITVVFGPLIYPEGKTVDELRDAVQDWIEGAMEDITVKNRFPY